VDASAPATAAYGDVKDSCAVACGIGAASCKPDPAIPTINSPACDNCTTTKCCLSLNSCFQSRPCKVAFECFVSCGPEFAALFNQPGQEKQIDESVQALCLGGEPAFFRDVSRDLTCVRQCVIDYLQPSQEAGAAMGNDAAAGPGCQSLALFGCAYDECHDQCAPIDGGADAASTAKDSGDVGDSAADGASDAGTD
jgi:hypothetical protein